MRTKIHKLLDNVRNDEDIEKVLTDLSLQKKCKYLEEYINNKLTDKWEQQEEFDNSDYEVLKIIIINKRWQ